MLTKLIETVRRLLMAKGSKNYWISQKNKPLAHTKLYLQRAKTMAHDLNKHDIAHQANTDDQYMYYIIA